MGSTGRRTTGIVLAVIGVLCLAAAAILTWVIVPNQAQLPANENTTRQFDGTAKLLLNPQAISTGNLSAALLTNVPVKVDRNVKTIATSGGVAQVRDTRTLTTATGQTVGRTEATYAVDRKTLEATTNHPSSWNVTNAKGLTVSWPIGADKKDYTGWVQETQTTTPLKYLREETKQGVSAYVYQATSQSQPIKDPQVLSQLPTALPVSTLSALSAVLPITPDVKAALAKALPRLTAPVPLSYTYQVQSTYWVEPKTGIVVDNQREDIRRAGLTLAGQTMAGVLPVFDVATAFTSQSVKAAATDAKNNKNKLQLYGTTLPLVLLVVGVILLLIGIALILLARRAPGAMQPRPVQPRTPTPA